MSINTGKELILLFSHLLHDRSYTSNTSSIKLRSHFVDFCASTKKSKNKMTWLIKTNLAMISDHRIIDDKTNRIAGRKVPIGVWRSCNQLLALNLRSNDSETCTECISAGMQSERSARHTKPKIDDYVARS